MSDPVDTDALRDMGATLTKDGHPFGPRIAAVADEVDRLRALIEKAPHADWCRGEWVQEYASGEYRGCTCWKADAL